MSDLYSIEKAVRERYRRKAAEKKANKRTSDTPSTLETIKSSVRDRYKRKTALASIGVDTLGTDITSLNDRIRTVYNGWQTSETMDNTRSSLQSMYDRVKAYEDYRKSYGGTDISDLSELQTAYKTILDEWDNISNVYGQFKNAEAYKRYEGMKAADLGAVQKEITALEGNLKTAKEHQSNIKGLQNRGNTWGHRGRGLSDGGYADKLKSAQTEYEKFLSGTGFKSFEELENALTEKKTYFDNAKQLQDAINLATKEEEMAYSQEGKTGWKEWEKYVAERAKGKAENKPSAFAQFGLDMQYVDNPVGRLIDFKREDTSYQEPQDNWTTKEKNIFGAYFLEDPNKAYDYAAKLNNKKAKTAKGVKTEEISDSATSGGWAGAGHTALSILSSPLHMIDYFDDLTDVAAGRRVLVEEDIVTPYDYSKAVTGGITEKLNADFGTLNEKIPVIGGKGLGDAYGLGTSVLQSAVSAHTLGPTGTLISYFGQGAASAVDDAIERGATPAQALLYGTLVGAAEGASEMIGVDNLLKIGSSSTMKELLVNVAKQAGAEGIEEGFSSLAEKVADNFVMGDKSKFNNRVNELYMYGGMSTEEAKKKAWVESVEEVAFDTLSGAVSGGVHAGPVTAINTAKQHSYNKNMGQTIKNNERVEEMFDLASNSAEISSAYETYTNLANKGVVAENISDAQLGSLYSSVVADAKEILNSNKSTEAEKAEALKTLDKLSVVTTDNVVAKEKKKFNVGEETKVTKSGVEVDVKDLKISEDNATFVTAKGEISANDVTLTDTDAEIVAHALAISKTEGEEVANLFVSQYDGKTNIEEYANAFELVSTLSKTESYTAEQILEAKGILSTEQATEIYKVTRMAQEKANVQAREQAFKKMRAMIGKQGVIDDSVISYDNKATKGQVNWKDLGYRQRKAITFANGLFTAMGSNVVWTNKDKSNGMYSIEGDTIFIDVYAGVNLVNLTGKDSIINTISHELTHQMEVYSPETFNEVKELVLDALEKFAKATDKSVTRADLIAKEIKRLDANHPEQKHTEADAISELVAKACEDMLSESKKGIELFNSLSKAEQKTLTEKIKDIISKLKNWITDLLKTYSSNSEEAKALRSMQDTFDEVLKRWDKMLADVAEQNKARKESGAVEKETSAEKRVLEQAREIDSDGNSYWQIETDKDIFKGIETVKGLQDAAYNYILNGDKGDKITDLIDGKELNFIRVSAKEYVYGEASKTLSTEEYKQKMRMSTSIIDLIENASIEYDAPDHKSHKMFPDGFKNYQGRVGIDETIFKYIVRVGKSKDGMIFYDINLEVDGKVPRANRTSLIKSSTSNNSISNPDKKVNTKSSKVLNEGKVLNADRDAEYLELAKDPVKNEARLREMVYEAAKEKGYTDDSSWRMGHTAPNSKDDISLDNLKESGLIPDDFWEHPEWYTHSYEERESYYKVKKAIELQETRNANGDDRPARMWVYRAVDKTKNKREDYFRNGDWVTPSKEYAINEGKMNPNGYRIIKHSVSIKNLYWDGNSIAELGYDDGNNYAYADTLNNRKLLDPVTYYPSGEIIPLSKRFNRRDYDVKFSDRDTEYLNAVEKGDVETASKLIEEAAERVFSNSKVRGSDGKLRLVYHGTVNDFTVFKRQFANIEGDFGKGYYFTSNEYDVDANYANEEGPDLKNKIAKYAEQLEWDDEYADLSYEEREEIARQKFITSEPTTITAYLNMENPVYITPDENGTLLDYNESYDEEYDEYGEPEGLLIDFIEALQNNATDYAYRDVDFSFLYEYAYDNGGVYASDAVKIIKERIVDELTDENEEIAVNEVIRLAFEEIGFDGIIDTSVYYKFRNMDGMDSGTTHYIVFDSEQIKSADIATYDDNGNVIPLSQRFDFSNEDIRYSDRDDVGYHAGDLGKAESLGSQGYGRDTGHFGRGTYFVGNKELVKDYNRRDGVSAPQHAVDFSNYNLYKIKNDKDGYDLHRQLQVIDGGLNAAWVKAAKDDKFFLYRGTEFYKIAEEKFGEENKYTDEALIYGLTELAKKADIEIPTKEQFSKESGYDLTDKYFDSAYQDHLKSVVSEQIEDIQNGYEKFRDAYWDLRMRFGFRGQVDEAMNKVLEYQKANRLDTLDAYKKDSLATVFMKALGYEGIDTRGTALDNTAYGSVIYDLREDSVLYSDREDISVYDILGETDRILAENEKLKADIARLNERLKIERKVTKGNYFNANQLGAVAGHLRNISNSTIDKVELMKSLKDVYSFIAESSEVITEELFEKCYRIADAMIENAKPEVIVDDYYKMILSDIRNTRISFSESQKKEAQNIFDKNWNRYFFGNVIITDKGIGLESKWQEWASQYPGVFDAEISDGDMVGELYNIISTLREASETVVEYNEEERKVWLANEIYNQYWNVSPIKTTADKYNERIKQLNFEHRKAMKELRDDYNSRLEAQKLADDIHYGKKVSDVSKKTAKVEEKRKADREKFQNLYRALRDRKDKEIATAKQHGKERMEKYKENAERKTRIQSITANATTLKKWLEKNNKDYHIHEAMKGPVVKLLKAIDFSSKSMLEKGVPTERDISFGEAFAEVRAMLQDADNMVEGLEALYGHDLAENIKALSEAAYRLIGDNNYIINKMSNEELKHLDRLVGHIKKVVSDLNKFHTVHHQQGAVNLANEFMEHGDKIGNIKKQHGTAGKFLKFRNRTPYYFFKDLGKVGEKLFTAFQDGWDKLAFNVKKVVDFTEETYTADEVKKWSKETKEFKLSQFDGSERTFKMSISQIMALYCVSKQEDGIRHLMSGGMTLKRIDKKGHVVADYENITLTLSDLQSILSTLNNRQKEVADKLQNFMNTVCSAWGNEISMARFGIEMFGLPDYFPIKVSEANHPGDNTKEVAHASLFRLLNMSFTKSRIPQADESIEIGDVFDIFAQHASDMAKYNALALPVLDFNKFYSIHGKDSTGKEYGVVKTLQSVFGDEANGYLRRFVRDLNGSQNVSRDVIGNTFFKNAKVASVANNLRVILLQPTAFYKASAVMDNKYLMKASAYIKVEPIGMVKKLKKAIENAEKYCGIIQWKSLGYYDTDISKGITEKIKHAETFKDKAIEKYMKGAEIADKVTFGTLWVACEFEIRDTRNDLKVGSAEFYDAVAKRLREIIYATQVVDSTMTRSDMMRSSDRMDKMLTTFGSEPIIAYNMLLDVVTQYSRDKQEFSKEEAVKKNLNKARKVVTAYVVTNVMAALIESAFDAFRDDDDEEMDMATFVKLYLKNFAFDMSIGNKLPVIKETYTIMQGYSSSRMDTQWLSYLYSAFTTKKPNKAIRDILKTASYVSGYAFYNLYRDLMATLNKLDIFTTEDLNEMFGDYSE